MNDYEYQRETIKRTAQDMLNEISKEEENGPPEDTTASPVTIKILLLSLQTSSFAKEMSKQLEERKQAQSGKESG